MATKSLSSQRAIKGAATRRANRQRNIELAGDYPEWVIDGESGELLDKLSLTERAILNVYRKLPADLKPRYFGALRMTGDALKQELTGVLEEFKSRGGTL